MDWTLVGSVIFTGLTVVFAVLVILMVCIDVLGKAVASTEGKGKAAPAAEPAVPVAAAPAANTISDEEVAVITAAVAAATGGVPVSIVPVSSAPVSAVSATAMVSDQEVAVVTAAVAAASGSHNFSIHDIKRVSQ